MVKRKKPTSQSTNLGFGANNPVRALKQAKTHARKEEWPEVCRTLYPLCQSSPQEKWVWELLVDASLETGEMKIFQKACEGLYAIAPSASNSYMLASAYLKNKHPLMALHTFHQALELDPDHELATQARQTIELLEPEFQDLLAEIGLTSKDDWAVAMLHEQGQAYMEQGDYEEAREAEEQVLEKNPTFISARNNLSLISWMQRDIEGAITTAQGVLDFEPNNVHALSNLIHFLVIAGKLDTAKSYGDQLKASSASAWDGWTKKVEGLTYLADDDGVVEVWEQAQAATVEESPSSMLFYHLSAVALARKGKVEQAISQWKIAVKDYDDHDIAKENLDNIRNPIGQRNGAWPFQWEQWINPQEMHELQQTLDAGLKSKKADKLVANFERFLKHHPKVMSTLPRVLERGGPQGQEFILTIAEQVKTPELLEMVKVFALSQNGTDAMRNRAANLAAQAKLIPKDKVTLWIEGEWREIMLLAYQFHTDPLVKHTKRVKSLLEEAIYLLRANSKKPAIEAETLLKQALAIEPDSPDLMNNLAMALSQQDREDETNALIHEIVDRYPDYLFASAAMAKLYLQNHEVEAAEALLHSFLSRDSFHIGEFDALMDAYIELSLAKKQREGARGWFNVWEQVAMDMQLISPQLKYWRKRFSSSL